MTSVLNAAVQAARAAGRIQKKHYGSVLRVRYKSKDKLNLVTEVDELCEKAVFSILRKSFPSHDMWGEESGRQSGGSPFAWVVDPLDGTTNYAHAYPFFCCSIALLRNGQPLAGVIYDPLRDECFTAEKGRGARLNGRLLKASSVSTLAESLLCTGFAYAVRETRYNLDNFKRFVLNSQGVRRDGSAALNLAYVAAGRFEGFWERGIQAWDMAAGVLLAREAGAKVTDITGKTYDLLAENVLAANQKIHPQMLRVLKGGSDEKNWKADRKKRN
jgi:myo-inositol-1(or 4)-monophosphatase